MAGFNPAMRPDDRTSEHRFIHVIGSSVFIDDRAGDDGWPLHFVGMLDDVAELARVVREESDALLLVDTVSSLGWAWDPKTFPNTMTMPTASVSTAAIHNVASPMTRAGIHHGAAEPTIRRNDDRLASAGPPITAIAPRRDIGAGEPDVRQSRHAIHPMTTLSSGVPTSCRSAVFWHWSLAWKKLMARPSTVAGAGGGLTKTHTVSTAVTTRSASSRSRSSRRTAASRC